ncbi:hypothetical protein BJV82DRAFT_631652 [Fennellomyces sp. T-0311]|nr:hypothetical protein BJV82DRAFT_631652 [Fennellomyces sp. T-0311]
MTQPGSARLTNAGGYSFPAGSTTYPKGGYGGFAGGAPNYQYSATRSTYTNYRSTYNGGYSPTTRSGWVGAYNPALVYWTMMPAFAFAGYYYAYHRYNQDDGAYFAPELSVSQGGGSSFVLNGTENTSDQDNYYYQFSVTSDYGYPQADHGFFASSDPETHPADFAFRLTFAHILEFDDVNQNGFYDDNESVVSSVSLFNVSWSPYTIALQQDTTNSSLTYYQFSTSGSNLTVNGQPFSVDLTWRSTNVQINMTEGVPLQPNSLQYNLTLIGYPVPTNATRRLAIAQVVTIPTTPLDVPFTKDVNTTTPVDVANQIKTNETYGISLGEYSEARLEYETSVNITEVANPPAQAGIPGDTNVNSWIWYEGLSEREHRLLYLSLPLNAGTNPRLSGFSFLDVNVMNAMADEYYSLSSKTTISSLTIVATLLALYTLL